MVLYGLLKLCELRGLCVRLFCSLRSRPRVYTRGSPIAFHYFANFLCVSASPREVFWAALRTPARLSVTALPMVAPLPPFISLCSLCSLCLKISSAADTAAIQQVGAVLLRKCLSVIPAMRQGTAACRLLGVRSRVERFVRRSTQRTQILKLRELPPRLRVRFSGRLYAPRFVRLSANA